GTPRRGSPRAGTVQRREPAARRASLIMPARRAAPLAALVATALLEACARGTCGTRRSGAGAAAYGIERDRETIAAMRVLGVEWSADVRRSQVLFLGYPNLSLQYIARATSPWRDDHTGLHHTYAEDGHGETTSCNGDLHYLVAGAHAPLEA